MRMKAVSTDNTDARWLKTPVAKLVRHIQSGNYYARIRVRGKLIWNSLKTDRISVAKLRLPSKPALVTTTRRFTSDEKKSDRRSCSFQVRNNLCNW